MKSKILAALLLPMLVVLLSGCNGGASNTLNGDGQDLGYLADPFEGLIGPVTMNPHPSSLEGKTVVLRWNGKPDGDVVLYYLAELLIKEGVKEVIKLWEVDPDSAIISGKENIIPLGVERSERFAAEAAEFNPDLVIASQAD